MQKGSSKLLMFILIACLLLVVFIPTIFRMFEKSKKEAFAKSTTEYISLVKTAYTTEELVCYDGGVLMTATFLGDGTFYVPLTSSKSKEAPKNYATSSALAFDERIPDQNGSETLNDIAIENAKNIIAKNGKSPFGKDIYGYIKIVRTGFNTEYFVKIVDTAGNGNPEEEEEIKANSVESIERNDLETYYAPEGQAKRICKFAE